MGAMDDKHSKPAHELRDSAGRYRRSHLCDACNKPAGTDPLCDEEVTDGNQVPGFILCERKRCLKVQSLPLEQRRAHYEATVAKRLT